MDNKRTIEIEESCLPVIESGEYRISAYVEDQQLGVSQTAEEIFRIDGPRFTLGREEIHAVYPGNGRKGRFGCCLPHIVFDRKTLPWERSMAQESADRICPLQTGIPSKEPPWIFLLLLHDDEILEVKSGTVKELIRPCENCFFPELYVTEEEKEQDCRFIDMPAELFQAVMPTEHELALLTHARKVQTQDGTTSWVSVEVGNRLPAARPEGGRNRVYLVSLEGLENWEERLRGRQYIRLTVLYSWEFYAVEEPQGFLEICHNLQKGRLEASRECKGELAAIEKNGYLPLPHVMRQGSQTVSFYRGPLTPGPVPQKKKPEESWCADGWYRYDPKTGVFDVSYAAAWQLGRMLALQNPSAVAGIQRKQEERRGRIRKGQEKKLLQKHGISPGEGEKISSWLLRQLCENKETLL